MIKIYGIKNCNTIKKALNWLEKNKIKYQFFDYKKQEISEGKLIEFSEKFGWEKVVNSRGTTWRKLSEQEKPSNQQEAVLIMKKNPSIIKRPIIESNEDKLLGFKEEEYQKFFNRNKA